MDQNSLDYLRDTHISEFNSQLSLHFLHSDKKCCKQVSRVNFSGSTGKLRPKSKRKEELKQSNFSPHEKKILFQSNKMLIHSEIFKSNKNEALLDSEKKISLTIKSLAFQSHSVLTS